jgi:cystathionine beta-lyase/cystathionine gamma-synthase
MAKHPDTDVLHLGEGARAAAKPLTTPIYATTTFLFDSAAEVEAYARGESEQYLYSRYENPTVQSVEEKLALLEGAEAALVTSSGMAATATAFFGLLRPGDELVCSSGLYGGTMHLATRVLAEFGVRVRFASLGELATPDGLLDDDTKLVWVESPINPTMRCVDLARIGEACRARGVLSVVDNTFASPINQQPLSLGIDLVMHSATKYLNGHSDVTCGALVGSRVLIDRLVQARRLFGGVLEPASAYAVNRGLKTLAVRVARQNDSALTLARWLDRDARMLAVFHPGLPSHPDHEVARRQMRGFGGMICIDLAGGYDAACRAYDRLGVFQRAASLGGVESLCSLPVLTSHYGFSDEQLAAAGVTRGMLRLSVGLEHPEDLIADLDKAL